MKILHVGVHNNANRNSGDTVLFEMVRQAFDFFSNTDLEWEKRQIWQSVTDEYVRYINENFSAIVIGGGGLLLKDQDGADSSASGWQWNCSIRALESIKVPIIVFAIGYNRFRGQEDFLEVFDEHISLLVKKSVFFSLRNNGSIKKLKQHLPEYLHFKLKRQYCPTTIIAAIRSYNENENSLQAPENIVAINAAFDRLKLRFGGDESVSLMRFNGIVEILRRNGFHPVIVAHKDDDAKIYDYLSKSNQSIDLVDLTDSDWAGVIRFYSRVSLSVGMRGHSQMIPLGLKRPIFSIITHDKMRYLLDDIDRLAWGAELSSEDFLGVFERYISDLKGSDSSVHSEIDEIVTRIANETKENIHLATETLVS